MTRARVFVIGAGMSAQVGLPLIGNFLNQMLKDTPVRKTRAVQEFLRSYSRNPNVEGLLSNLDTHLAAQKRFRGSPFDRLKLVRRELIHAIIHTLSKGHYNHLQQHYGLMRGEDPFYYSVRRSQAVDRARAMEAPASKWPIFNGQVMASADFVVASNV